MVPAAVNLHTLYERQQFIGAEQDERHMLWSSQIYLATSVKQAEDHFPIYSAAFACRVRSRMVYMISHTLRLRDAVSVL